MSRHTATSGKLKYGWEDGIHIRISCYLGLLAASPYIVYQIFRFISPALYEQERKYSVFCYPDVCVVCGRSFMLGLVFE